MKGIIFTLDSVFALAIVVLCISILLYFQYYAQTPYAIHYSNVQDLLSYLSSTSVVSLQNSSALAGAIATQYLGANETSPQFLGGPQTNSSNLVGPKEGILSYVFNPSNTVTMGLVADYGDFYFGAGSNTGNTLIYAVNATTNRTAWVRIVGTNGGRNLPTPALYSGMLIYANETNLTAVNARSGALIWTTKSIQSITPVTTPIIAYANRIFFGASSSMYSYYANNGTQVWSNSAGSAPISLAVLRGTVIELTTSQLLITLFSAGASTAQLVSTTYTSGNPPTNNLAGSGTVTYLGTGTSANAIYVNGTVVTGFPIALGSAPTGVATFKNYVVFQTAAGVNAMSPSGTPYWNTIVPVSYNGPLENATPVVTATSVYTLWSNGLAAMNLTTGKIQWFSLIPRVHISPYMALAYGRLYVMANNKVYAYGTCDSPLYASLLSAAATMYLNSQTGCGIALLNSVYPLLNYSLYVSNSVSQTITTAGFSGASGRIDAKNIQALNTSDVSVVFWINISAYPASGAKLLNYGDNGTCLSPSTYCGWFFYLTSSNVIQFSIQHTQQIPVNGLVLNKNRWYMITGVFNGTYADEYINSNTPYTVNSPVATIFPTTPNINLTIGAGNYMDTRYFTGNIANVQIYSKPILRTQVAELYLRGVDGVPLKGYGLVAWYPLAGDANDYAGFNPGFLSGPVGFTTQNYKPPGLSNAYEVTKSSTLLSVTNYTTGVANAIKVGVYSWS